MIVTPDGGSTPGPTFPSDAPLPETREWYAPPPSANNSSPLRSRRSVSLGNDGASKLRRSVRLRLPRRSASLFMGEDEISCHRSARGNGTSLFRSPPGVEGPDHLCTYPVMFRCSSNAGRAALAPFGHIQKATAAGAVQSDPSPFRVRPIVVSAGFDDFHHRMKVRDEQGSNPLVNARAGFYGLKIWARIFEMFPQSLIGRLVSFAHITDLLRLRVGQRVYHPVHRFHDAIGTLCLQGSNAC